jgi:hypothetical protein
MVITVAFLGFAGLIVVALLSYSGTSFLATKQLASVRGTDYDADGAVEAAIATIRAVPVSGNTYQGYVGQCDPYESPSASLNNTSARLKVYCTPRIAPPFQREVLLTVCPHSASTSPCSDNQSVLRANVKFYDDQHFGRAVAIETWSTAP